jgi:hypothetical protein
MAVRGIGFLFLFFFLVFFFCIPVFFEALVCSSKVVHSGALIPRRSTAQCEGRRISFVRSCSLSFMVFVFTFTCLPGVCSYLWCSFCVRYILFNLVYSKINQAIKLPLMNQPAVYIDYNKQTNKAVYII